MAFFAGGSSFIKEATKLPPEWEKKYKNAVNDLFGSSGSSSSSTSSSTSYGSQKYGGMGAALSGQAAKLRDELLGMSDSMTYTADANYNELLRQIADEYNRMAVDEAGKARDWSASQSALDREFNATEAEKARLWQESMTASQNQFNAAEAEKARSWQESMRNSAYQSTMADLQKAGLNPILAYSQGASATPVASSATASSVGATSSGSHSSGYATSAANVKQRASSISFALKAMDALISSHSNSASNLSSGLGALGAVLSAVVRAFAS